MLNIQIEVKSLSHKDERQAANSFVSRHDAFTGAWRGGRNRLSFSNQKGFQIWLCAPTQHSGQVHAQLLAHGSDIWPWEKMAAIFTLCFSIWYDTLYASLCTRVGQSYSWPVLAGWRHDGVHNRLKWKTSCTLSLMTFNCKTKPLCERLAHRYQRYSPLRQWKKKSLSAIKICIYGWSSAVVSFSFYLNTVHANVFREIDRLVQLILVLTSYT